MKQKKKNRAPSSREKGRVDELVHDESLEMVPNRRQETRIELPAGKPDLEALRSVTREWLVPLLVEKFLREQGIELRARPNAEPGKTPISDPLVAEGLATSQISPEADANLPGGSEKNGLDRGAECQRMEKTTTNPLGKGARRSTHRRE
jgi:hypothetical protein